MSTPSTAELMSWLSGVDIAVADAESCAAVLQGLSRLIAWAESHKVAAAQRLAQLAAESPAIFPEHVVAEATRVSLGRALEPFKRASAIEAFPRFGDALRSGDVSTAHVDVLAGALGKLDDRERESFVARGDFLGGVAQQATPGEFARVVRAELLRCRRG
ncbi:MAG TPA: DUF222 domain-containing protein, partial [Ilumatobacteraceae bacterium]|nr:DUF222 domain-containing protein [Ilumatobacteraceae bacterium]